MARAEHSVAEAAGRFLDSFQRPARLLIAISGGSDSTGLFVALATLCATGRYPGITLCASTVDHALRSGSAEEAAAVGRLCARYAIPHTICRWHGEKPATGLQAAARAKRYALLSEAAISAGADAILSGHTCDDQAETIAMRAERSPEGVGLSGMADAVLLQEAIWLLRPFLAVGRAAVRRFLTARGEAWIDDPSNLNARFERVRVRQREEAEGPRYLDGERRTLSERAAAFLLQSVRRENGVFFLPGDSIGVVLADPAAWRGLLMLAATVGGRVHALEAASAGRLRAFLASGTLSRFTAGRVVFDRRRDGLFLYREDRGIAALIVAAGERAAWDGRYRVVNRGTRPMIAGAADKSGADELRGPAMRARKTMPCLKFEDGAAVPADVASVDAIVSPYALFLPRFDLPLANALATLLGNEHFPSPPNE